MAATAPKAPHTTSKATAPLSSPEAVDPSPPPATPRKDPMAITGIVLGGVSFVTGPLIGVAAIVFSVLSLNRVKQDPNLKSRKLAMIGLVLGIVGTILGTIAAVYVLQSA